MSFRSLVLNGFRKVLPPISRTEKEALESGTVGWDGEIMSGSPDWKRLFDLQKPALTAEEQSFIDNEVEELCRMIDTWSIQKNDDLPAEAWQFIKDKGFFGLEIPKEFGGHGFSSQAHSAIVIKIASRNITAAVTVMVPNSLGPGELIHKYGTQQQKDYYLPRLAKGIEVPCFALTGPDAGSDAGAIPDRGIVVKNDKGEIGIRLNWEKRYITLGPVATIIGLAFKLEDPDNLLGKNIKDFGITCALVPRDTPGIEIGERHKPMDLPFRNGPNRGKDVFLPIDNIIGGAEMAGHGWRMLMECLAVGRCLSLPALSTAGAKLSCYTTGAYSMVRKQFNAQVGKFEGIEEVLGRMAGLTYMMDATRLATLQMVDQDEKPAIPSAILKYHLTESMRKIVNDAMDIHGGKAICNGPKNIFADVYKGIPVAITVEGANIMTRNLIIFGQGSVRAHPYVLKEIEAANDPDEVRGFKNLICAFSAHVGSVFYLMAKSLLMGLTCGFFTCAPEGTSVKAKKYYKRVNHMATRFALATNFGLLLGGKLKFKERFSARMGDIFSNIYMTSTVLWKFEKDGCPEEDLPLVRWASTHALFEAQEALDQSLRNHPLPWAGYLLRPILFPLGRCYKKPCDKLDAKSADTIRAPGAARDRLTMGIYKPTDTGPVAMQEKAFHAALAAEPLEKKIYKATKAGTLQKGLPRKDELEAALAAGVLTQSEYSQMKDCDALRREVVMVDAF